MKLQFLLPFVFHVSCALGQGPTLELTYEYLNMGPGETRVVTLLVNNQESLSLMGKTDTTNSKDLDFNIDGEDADGRQVYRNVATGELIFRDFVSRDGNFEPCLIRDPLKYSWIYEPVARKIGPYECRSAKTKFRGRAYTAWYTEELSVPHGPWKFTGLPGAIVEVKSDDEAITFRLLKVASSQSPIPRIAKGKEITIKEFVAMEENATADFINRLAAKLPRGAQMTYTVTGNYDLETSYDDVKR